MVYPPLISQLGSRLLPTAVRCREAGVGDPDHQTVVPPGAPREVLRLLCAAYTDSCWRGSQSLQISVMGAPAAFSPAKMTAFDEVGSYFPSPKADSHRVHKIHTETLLPD